METKEMALDYFKLSPLPFASDALEPYIDQKTMEIHHDKHHQAYVTNLNKALTELNIDPNISLEDICVNVSKYPKSVRNNAGGHYNHTFFWNIISPKGRAEPSGKLADALYATFGSIENFKEQFQQQAMDRFGSGWAWLVVDNGKLNVGSTPNQDNPIMDISDFKGQPILGVDVWEHAYYLKYQNRRAEYLSAFWNVINWNEVSKRYKSLL